METAAPGSATLGSAQPEAKTKVPASGCAVPAAGEAEAKLQTAATDSSGTEPEAQTKSIFGSLAPADTKA